MNNTLLRLLATTILCTTGVAVAPASEINESRSATDFIMSGKRFNAQKQYKKAIKEFNKAIAIDKSAIAYNYRGYAYFKLRRYSAAVQDCTTAISLNPNFALAYETRGLAHAELGQKRKAMADFSQAISIEPKNSNFYLDRAVADESDKLFKQEIEDCTKAISLSPRAASSYAYRAGAHIHLKQYREAIQDFSSGLAILPNYSFLAARACAYELAGDPRNAIKDLNSAFRLGPATASDYVSRGNCYHALGLEDRAIEDFNAALRINPNLEYATDSRALAYEKLVTQQELREKNSSVSSLQSSPLPCEQYITFVDPGDKFEKQYLRDRGLAAWTKVKKQLISDAFCALQKRAPGFVARACNGQKLKFALSAGKAPSGEETLMSTTAVRSLCYPSTWRLGPKLLEATLAHELTHDIDTCRYLSSAAEWNRLIVPYLTAYRAQPHKCHDKWQMVDPEMAPFGLPTRYATTDPAEALAEDTAAMVTEKWEPPAPIKSFIENKILQPPGGTDLERDLLAQAQAESVQSHWKQSIEIDTRVLKLDPECIPAWLDLSFAWMMRDEYDVSRDCSIKCMKIIKLNGMPPYSSNFTSCRRDETEANEGKLRQQSNECVNSGQYQQALECFETLLKNNPRSESTYQQRAIAYQRMKQDSKAIEDFTNALLYETNNKDRTLSYYLRGDSYLKLGKEKQALADYNNAVTTDPSNMAAVRSRGSLYAKLGNNTKAFDDWSRCLSVNSNDSGTHLERAYLNQRLGRYAQAIDDWNECIRLEPKEWFMYSYRSDVYAKLGKKELADKDLQTANRLRGSK